MRVVGIEWDKSPRLGAEAVFGDCGDMLREPRRPRRARRLNRTCLLEFLIPVASGCLALRHCGIYRAWAYVRDQEYCTRPRCPEDVSLAASIRTRKAILG